MSDFDEEAERERLREKYEQEEQKREATERMSELLLKGATMTNAHCETCGDPIFRYEGQAFCPTCEEVVAEDGTRADADSADGTDETVAESDGTPSESTRDRAAEPETADRTGEGRPEQPSDSGTESDQASDLPERRERARVPDRDRRPSDELRRPDPPARRDPVEGETGDAPASDTDLSVARESLRRSVARFAREAERADDPRRAREHLEAAHEAADALVSLSEIR